MPRLKTNEQFDADLAERNPRVKRVGTYVGSQTKIDFQCVSCNNVWSARPYSVLSGTGCLACANKSRTKTQGQFDTELAERNPRVKRVGTYVGAMAKTDFQCVGCNNVWSARPSSVLRGHGCRACYEINRTKTQEQFDTELAERNPRVKRVGTYVGTMAMINFQCAGCNNVWPASPHNILRGMGCTACGVKKLTKSQEQFDIELAERNPRVKRVGTYVNTKTKIDFQCVGCNNIWSTRPRDVLRGRGCPTCKGKKIAKKLTKTQEQFDADLAERNPRVRRVGTYVGVMTKTDFQCVGCDNVWSTVSSCVLSGHGCPACGRKKLAKGRTKTQEQFDTELAERNPRVKRVGTYAGVLTKIDFQCVGCNNVWPTAPSNVLNGTGCPKRCGKKVDTDRLVCPFPVTPEIYVAFLKEKPTCGH